MSIITCIQNVGFIGLFLSVCISCDLGISAQTVDTKPHVILEVGTRGVLPCPIHGQAYLVEWKRQGTSELEPLVSLDPYFNVGARDGPSYKAGLVNITEDYSLVIKDVKVQNEGLYLCDVSDYEMGKHILNWIQVSVQALPDEPFPIIRECMRKDSHPGPCILKVNSTSKLTCLVEGYYPHIELYFLHGSEKVVSTIYEWRNKDGTKNKNITILISVNDEPYKCVASGLPGIVGNRTVTVFAQANASPQGSSTEEIVIIVFTVVVPLMLAVACLFKWYRRNSRACCSLSGFSLLPTDSNDIRRTGKLKKLFKDPIHGNMVFEDKLLIKIIDTPQFQRLRNIKQLWGCYYVYPGSAHNRFEHSLGVCHLAGEFIRTLRDNQPELNITDNDIRRVEIAGLCHDLGHGPLSRVFAEDFIQRRSRKHPELEGLKKEDLSVMMFDHLIQENKLKSEDLNDSDITEIKRMMKGVKDDVDEVAAEKRFLYQIVTNKSTGIDVDKFDYLARDCHQLGISKSFDSKRCMKFARVIKLDNGRRILCFKHKEAGNLYPMFRDYYLLHKRAYQHRVSNIIEHMIMDAFDEAEDATDEHGEKCFKIFPAGDGSKLTMTETLIKQDMHAYTYMTDTIVERILSTTEKELERAREIIENVQKRDKTRTYQFVDEVQIPSEYAEDFPEELKASDIVNELTEANAGLKEDLIVKVMTINHGQKDQNPMKNVHFFYKLDPDKAVTLKDEDVDFSLPKAFQERFIRIYCKRPDGNRNADLKTDFVNWYKRKIDSMKQEAQHRDRRLEPPGRENDGTTSTRDGEKEEGMVFKDPIHGNMVFEDELLIKIIHTPQFQRLRNIKQLGGCYYVYPGAAHNRFEHSLGVCHLAGRLIRTLRDNQPELNITVKDIRRLEIAGLCRYLGYGPLSRVFDKQFIPRRKRKHPELEGLKNEDLCVMMFDYMIKQNNLKSEDLNDSDITEIKRMIKGVKDDDNNVDAEKLFLYQIVTNKSTGIDVHIFDYLARDHDQLGETKLFDSERCMKCARAIHLGNGRRILCFGEEEAENLYHMFRDRYILHRKAYQHRVCTIIEHIIMDAFEEAEDATDDHGEKCFKILPAKDGSKLTVTETLIKQDMHAYTYMTDSIVERILSTTEKELEKAREILENVQKRDKTKLYRFFHDVLIPSEHAEDFIKKWKEEQKIVDDILGANAGLEDNFIVEVVSINYGQKDQNPIKNVHFYSKSDPDKADLMKDEEISSILPSSILPKAFQEIFIRVYCKNPDYQRNEDLKTAFEKWYNGQIGSLKQEALNRERGQKTPDRGTSRSREQVMVWDIDGGPQLNPEERVYRGN